MSIRWTPSPVTIIYIYIMYYVHIFIHRHRVALVHGRVRVVVNCDKKIIKIKVAE